MYLGNKRVPQQVRQSWVELQGQRNKSVIITGDCQSHALDFGRSSRQKIHKDRVNMKSTTDKYNLIGI